MKKNVMLLCGLCAALLFTGCKSRESAYRQAYEQAMAQGNGQQSEQQAVTTTPVESTVSVTPVAPATPTEQGAAAEDHSDVREIKGGTSVVSGSPLKAYSVVVGSFVTQANAEGLKERLQSEGFEARVLKTNETINGTTGWYRVIASSYADKASAAQSRNTLNAKYPGAWILYTK